MFDAEHGMFVHNEDSRLCWFASAPLPDADTIEEYTLIGRLIALAIYNGVILNIHFPIALYKKLLDEKVGLADLEELDPQLHKGLLQLLTFPGDVRETFNRTFEIEIETAFGRTVRELIPGGSEQYVDDLNREDFVALYVDHILNRSVEHPFRAFQNGFDSVLRGTAVELFRAEELQNLVCGSPEFDFDALEKSAQYDGYEKDTPVIRYFWNVVHSMTDDEKKRLLFFTTGSDRVPVGGLGSLPFIIARNGGDSDRLPTSHTCYNVLLLNDYSTEEKLRERLLKALENYDCGFYLS
ncbi:hypothetical protein HDV00_000170 [Rhizophlyctis rosea]|nr:hypothetical protein HDV00_000170 [Rhizophlyctis rosea]